MLYSRILSVAAGARLRSMLRPRRKDGAMCGGGGGRHEAASLVFILVKDKSWGEETQGRPSMDRQKSLQ